MAEQQALVEDTQVIFDGSQKINQEELRNLSKYASERIDELVRQIINFNDSPDVKAELEFWKRTLYYKNACLRREFTGNDFKTKALSVVKQYGQYLTCFDDGKYRLSNSSDIAIYLALKVMGEQIHVKEAIATLNDFLK